MKSDSLDELSFVAPRPGSPETSTRRRRRSPPPESLPLSPVASKEQASSTSTLDLRPLLSSSPGQTELKTLDKETATEIEKMKMSTEVRVLTLNCWGLRFISNDRVARMKAIADKLSSGDYDFVFLQEVWTTEDYERIRQGTAEVLPWSHYFFSGVIGSGLAIFSRSPIKSAFFHQWAVNGYIHKFWHGDWFGGKGIGMVEVDHRGIRINLYTAHLHAEYNRKKDEYLAHRITQAFDTAQFIQVTSRHVDAAIVGGDLNTEPGDLAYRLIVNTAGLVDAVAQALDSATTSTCDTSRNSYTATSVLKKNPGGKRLDYVLYKGGGTGVNVQALSLDTPWPDRVPGKPFSYSDHEAVVGVLQIRKTGEEVRPALHFNLEPPPPGPDVKKAALEESVRICDKALGKLHRWKNIYILVGLAMLGLLSWSSGWESPKGFLLVLLSGSQILALIVLLFSIFMSVIWHRMEVHGILAGKLGMKIELGRPLEPDEEVLPDRSILGRGEENWNERNPGEDLP